MKLFPINRHEYQLYILLSFVLSKFKFPYATDIKLPMNVRI
jgi:hypothetical protein